MAEQTRQVVEGKPLLGWASGRGTRSRSSRARWTQWPSRPAEDRGTLRGADPPLRDPRRHDGRRHRRGRGGNGPLGQPEGWGDIGPRSADGDRAPDIGAPPPGKHPANPGRCHQGRPGELRRGGARRAGRALAGRPHAHAGGDGEGDRLSCPRSSERDRGSTPRADPERLCCKRLPRTSDSPHIHPRLRGGSPGRRDPGPGAGRAIPGGDLPPRARPLELGGGPPHPLPNRVRSRRPGHRRRRPRPRPPRSSGPHRADRAGRKTRRSSWKKPPMSGC